MSYCRQPYYIYPNINGTVCFDVFGDIPDDVVNVFLYKLYIYRKEEFDKRVQDGQKELEEWELNKDKPLSQMEEFLGLDKIKPIETNIEVDDFSDFYNEELKDIYNNLSDE